MSVASKQPEIRFNKQGPMDLAGVSYAPKVILIDKLLTTAEGYDDVLSLPAGTYISDVYAVVTDGTGVTTAEFELGFTDSTQALINHTQLSMETDHNAFHFHTGYYLGAANTLRLTVGGTSAAGGVRVVLSYFELAAMAARGKHFSL